MPSSQTLGTPTAFTISFNTLANVTYVAGTAVDLGAAVPLDVLLSMEVVPGTVAGNKQALLFLQVSLDGTDYTTGPTSGTTVVDQPNLMYIGALPLLTNSTLQRMVFSVQAALGFTPRYIKPVIFNDSGAAFASGGVLKYQTVTVTP